jgi:ABC-2 type transport system ATP-binding protein
VLTATVMDAAKASCSLGLSDLQLAAPDGRVLIQPSTVTIGSGVTSLVGSNGSGKSTLLRALATLHPLAGGSAVLNGTDIQRAPRAFLEQSVYLPQNFATYPELTGREFLEYSLRLRGAGRQEARAAADAWLDAVGLRAASKSKTGAYSQGMRQRLGFAYAMQLEVSLYLLDEPFAGVDPESRHSMTDLLFRLAADRIAIVSTHHVDEMYARGSGFVRIAEGKLVQ